MNTEIVRQPKTYKLIDWNKPKPVLPERETQLTEHEAHTLNRGLMMNRTTLRYIKVDG